MLFNCFEPCLRRIPSRLTPDRVPMSAGNLPIFVAVAICKHKVRQFLHHSLSCGVHQIKRISVIWLDEFVFRRESGSVALAEAL
jgi:hypothetical protein